MLGIWCGCLAYPLLCTYVGYWSSDGQVIKCTSSTFALFIYLYPPLFIYTRSAALPYHKRVRVQSGRVTLK